jgi:hypothetical protein
MPSRSCLLFGMYVYAAEEEEVRSKLARDQPRPASWKHLKTAHEHILYRSLKGLAWRDSYSLIGRANVVSRSGPIQLQVLLYLHFLFLFIFKFD